MSTDWKSKMAEAAAARGLVPGQAASPAPVHTAVEQPGPGEAIVLPKPGEDVGEPTDADIDVALAHYGGEMDIHLKGGGTMRVTHDPKPNSHAVEVSHEWFKTIIRVASRMKGHVVRVMTKEQADKLYADPTKGVWINPNLWVEINREKFADTRPTTAPFEMVGEPTVPQVAPDPGLRSWFGIPGVDITRTKPVRSGARVVGVLSETVKGWMFTATTEIQRLAVDAPWAAAGVFQIDDEVFKESIHPNKAVVLLRTVRYGDQLTYLATAESIRQHAGFVRIHGAPKIVVPATNAYWLVLDQKGEPYER